MAHPHGPDMQGRNVLAVHRDEAGQRQPFVEQFNLDSVVNVARSAGSVALEHLFIQPAGRVLSAIGAVAGRHA